MRELKQTTSDYNRTKIAVHMIKSHRPEGVMPVSVFQMENDVTLKYDIEGYTPLSEYLSRHIIDELVLTDLLKQLLFILGEAEKYYLNSAEFLLTADDVYIDPSTKKLGLIYAPSVHEINAARSEEALPTYVQALIRTLIYEHVRLETQHSQMISECLKYLKEPGWHLKGLWYLLDSEVAHKPSEPQMRLESEVKNASFQSRVVMEKQKLDESAFGLDSIHVDKEKVPSDNPEKKRLSFDLSGKLKEVSIAIMMALFVVILALIRTMRIDFTEKVGMTLVVGALILLILKKSLAMMSMNDHKEDEKTEPIEKLKKQRFEPISLEEQHESHSKDRTVMLGSTFNGHVLIGRGGLKIPLNKDRLVIGRQDGVADILLDFNASVGRQHAELIRIESGYAVRDLKSVNGTFVNDEKVEEKQAIVLLHGDVLKISDEQFTFQTI